jgi:2-hydroxycyclohexanecarboxyl-CoA dehydrogenase
MNLQLQNDVVVVVGGAQGIGWAIAQAFGAEGATVICLDRDARVTKRDAPGVHGLLADVTDYAALQNIADDIWKTEGRCDHVVYAAGMGSGKFGAPFWNLEPTDWARVLDVNLLGAVHTAHAFAPRMAEAQQGTFLFLASIAGQIGSQTDPPYSAAKAGLINFAMCAARDLAPHNVRVNTLCPGMVKTALNQSTWAAWNALQPEEKRLTYDAWAAEKIARVTPLNRWQEPEDVAALAVFLASPQARNITGQTMNVDGGQVMHW